MSKKDDWRKEFIRKAIHDGRAIGELGKPHWESDFKKTLLKELNIYLKKEREKMAKALKEWIYNYEGSVYACVKKGLVNDFHEALDNYLKKHDR